MSDSLFPADILRKHFNRMELPPASHGMDVLRRRFSRPLFALMGIVGLVLLMAIANIANLLLARGIARQGEFAIRLATGAGKTRLMRQLLTETMLLFCFSLIPGVMVAGWGVDVIETLFTQGRRAIVVETGLNWRVLAFSSMMTLAAGLAAGLFPAWRAMRTDPAQAIQEGHMRTSESRGSANLSQTLVAFQVALSLVLLVGAATFVRTLANLRNVDPGFQNEHALTMSIEKPEGYRQAGKTAALWNEVLQAVRGIPGVRDAGLATFTPLSRRDTGAMIRASGYTPQSSEDSMVHVNQVSEGFSKRSEYRCCAGEC